MVDIERYEINMVDIERNEINTVDIDRNEINMMDIENGETKCRRRVMYFHPKHYFLTSNP